jgi:hypothetical protein
MGTRASSLGERRRAFSSSRAGPVAARARLPLADASASEAAAEGETLRGSDERSEGHRAPMAPSTCLMGQDHRWRITASP